MKNKTRVKKNKVTTLNKQTNERKKFLGYQNSTNANKQTSKRQRQRKRRKRRNIFFFFTKMANEIL